MHKEVEVKAKLQNPELVLAKLKERGVVLDQPIAQHDKVFSPQDLKNFTDFHTGVSFLRIRREENRSLLTLKKSGLNELDNTEIELEVGNPDALEKLLAEIGYKLSVEVKKVRQKGKIDKVEICLDKIEGLGTFIELEKLMAIDSNVELVQTELFELLKELGINDSDRVNQGYDTLMAIAQGQK
jgi:adenylate cyclase class 2